MSILPKIVWSHICLSNKVKRFIISTLVQLTAIFYTPNLKGYYEILLTSYVQYAPLVTAEMPIYVNFVLLLGWFLV